MSKTTATGKVRRQLCPYCRHLYPVAEFMAHVVVCPAYDEIPDCSEPCEPGEAPAARPLPGPRDDPRSPDNWVNTEVWLQENDFESSDYFSEIMTRD